MFLATLEFVQEDGMRMTLFNVSALRIMITIPFCVLKAPPVLCSKRLDGHCIWMVHVTIVAGDGTHRLNQGVVSGALKQLPKKNYSHDIVTPNVNANLPLINQSPRETYFLIGRRFVNIGYLTRFCHQFRYIQKPCNLGCDYSAIPSPPKAL
jgi:hypothetical protein